MHINLPTDRLDKFLALGGAVLTFVSLYFPLRYAYSVQMDYRNFDIEFNALRDASVEKLDEEFQQILDSDQYQQRVRDRIDMLAAQGASRAEAEAEVLEFANELAESRAREAAMNLRERLDRDLHSRADVIRDKIRVRDMLLLGGGAGALAGVSISVIGFISWYKREKSASMNRT